MISMFNVSTCCHGAITRSQADKLLFSPSLGLKHKTDSQFLGGDVIDKASVTDWSRSRLFALIHINRKLNSNIVRVN